MDDNKKINNEEKDNRKLNEKIEDCLDEAFGTMEDVVYGKDPDFNKSIPASMVNGSEIRKINKVQTRKNLNKRILGTKGLKIMIIIFAIGLIVCGLYFLIEKMLLA